MAKKKKVYVAGPYSGGQPVLNTRKAIEVGDQLADEGFVPFIPHLNHFWHYLKPRGYDFWLNYDIEWLKVCDVLLRIPGDSPGADKEVSLANDLGIPVYDSIEDLIECE